MTITNRGEILAEKLKRSRFYVDLYTLPTISYMCIENNPEMSQSTFDYQFLLPKLNPIIYFGNYSLKMERPVLHSKKEGVL